MSTDDYFPLFNKQQTILRFQEYCVLFFYNKLFVYLCSNSCHTRHPKVLLCTTEGLYPRNFSIEVNDPPVLRIRFRISSAYNRHSAHRFAGSPQWTIIYRTGFINVRFIRSALPFSSGVYGADTEASTPSSCRDFAAFIYSLPPSVKIRKTCLPACLSIHATCLSSSRGASPFSRKALIRT